MKKTTQQKGITLIALIITIVVLLILAAVAIGAVKDSNIIAHAQNAAVSYNQAKANQTDALAKYEQELNKYIPKESKVEYYRVEFEDDNEGDVIQKVDYEKCTCSTYKIDYLTGEYQLNGEPVTFVFGEPTTDIVQIPVKDYASNTTNNKDLKVGAMSAYVGDFAIGYIEDKVLYAFMMGESYYVAFELVEDKSEISAIESGIASIK